MNTKKKDEKTIDWEDVLAFLIAKRNHMEKLEKGCSQRRKDLEVS